MKNIPIIIPFKETSSRCPNKNFTLFPYAIQWLERQNISKSGIYVVSKSNRVENIAQQYKVNFVYEIECKNPNNIIAAATVAKQLDVNAYIELPLTQPVKNANLIKDVVDALQSSDCDFVTTYQTVTDRSLFYLDDNLKFLNESKNRKGCMCKEMKMLDGAIYGIKLSFAEKIIDAEDINAAFWAGNFKAIKNNVDFFIDIDTKTDMKKFSQLSANYFSF